MNWLTVTALGATGGMLVEAVNLYERLMGWQSARREAQGRDEHKLPRLSDFIDVPADTLVALTRFGLGALAGLVLHSQVTGSTAAVAVGACAPALLRQLGASQTLSDAVRVVGTAEELASATSAGTEPRRTASSGLPETSSESSGLVPIQGSGVAE